MMEFNATSIALAIVATGQIVLGCVLYLQGRKNLSNLFFAATSILIGTWIGVHEARFFYYTRIGHSVPPFWFSKISLALAASIFYSFLLFAYSFPQNKLLLNRVLLWTSSIVYIFIVVASFLPRFILIDERFQPGQFSPIYHWGSWYTYFYTPAVYTYFAWGILYFLYRYYEETNQLYKKQFRIVLFGSGIAGLNGVFFALIVPLFVSNAPGWIGSLGTLIFTAFATYAILKFQLFDIKIVTTELLTFTIWIFLLARTLLATNLWDQWLKDFRRQLQLILVCTFLGI